MKKNLITIGLCLLVAIIIVLTGIFFVKAFNKPQEQQDSDNTETKTETEIETENESAPEPDIGESDSNVTQPETDAESDSPTSNTEPTDNVQTPAPDNTADNTADSNEQTVEGNTGSESTLGSTEVTVPAAAPKSYTEFSLTKNMTAKEAYEYLDSFLNSKYSILLNKQNRVSSDYEPTNLVTPSGCQYKMESTAATALVNLLSGAKADGINDLVLYSGYRTVASQRNKYETRTQKYLNQGYSQAEAEAKAGEYIAPPGASEHHTGLAADVCSSSIVNKYGYLSDEFDTTAAYRWMAEHCTEYGFIIRYTKGDEDITGYSYEPWHLRYLGVDHATACTQLGYTYEEYHAMLIKLRDEAKSAA